MFAHRLRLLRVHGGEVVLKLKGADMDRVGGKVDWVASTGACAIIGGTHVPLALVVQLTEV